MRLDDLLNNREQTLSKRQYKKLKETHKPIFLSFNDNESLEYDLTPLEKFTKDEAKQWLHEEKLLSEYERDHEIYPRHPSIISFNFVHHDPEKEKPEPPEALKPYLDQGFSIPEAFFKQKFDI